MSIKRITILTYLIIILNFFITAVVAQSPSPNVTSSNNFSTSSNPPPNSPLSVMIPGANCGLPGAANGADRCCFSKPPIPRIPETFGGLTIPYPFGVNKIWNGIHDSIFDYMLDHQKEQACVYGKASSDPASESCTCNIVGEPSALPILDQLCKTYLPGSPELTSCSQCALGQGRWAGKAGIWTGIGCVPVGLGAFISEYVMTFGIGFGGIVAFGCILYSAFQIQTSQGSPEKIKNAQQTMTSCIMGLILLIFSVFILQVIGVDILRIPGLTK